MSQLEITGFNDAGLYANVSALGGTFPFALPLGATLDFDAAGLWLLVPQLAEIEQATLGALGVGQAHDFTLSLVQVHDFALDASQAHDFELEIEQL